MAGIWRPPSIIRSARSGEGTRKVGVLHRRNANRDDWRASASRLAATRSLVFFLLAAVALANLLLLAAQAVAFRFDALAGAFVGGATGRGGAARAAAELRLERAQHVVHSWRSAGRRGTRLLGGGL